MKIDLSEEMKDLDGEVLAGGSAGRLIAEYMMGASTRQPVRLFKLAMQLLDEREFDVDQNDIELLSDMVEKSTLPNIMKAHILMKLGNE